MAKLREEQQQIRVMSWEEFDNLATKLAYEITEGNKNIHRLPLLYGIPRGGLIVATCLTHIDENFDLYLEDPICRNIICSDSNIVVVDDIVDSGETAIPYFDRYQIGTLFWREGSSFKPDYYAEKLETDVWIKFPWEKTV